LLRRNVATMHKRPLILQAAPGPKARAPSRNQSVRNSIRARMFSLGTRAFRGGVAALALLLTFSAQRSGQSAPTEKPGEYQVKAAIVFNLAKYVEWPAQAFADDSSPLILGILGEDKFGDDFRRMVEDKTINRRALLVKHL